MVLDQHVSLLGDDRLFLDLHYFVVFVGDDGNKQVHEDGEHHETGEDEGNPHDALIWTIYEALSGKLT